MKGLVFLLFLMFPFVSHAVTYTVCTSGCSYTTIQDVFDNENLDAGDIVELQADTPGGSRTFSDDGGFGAVAAPLGNDDGFTMRPRSGDTITIDGGSLGRAVRLSFSGSDITVQDLNITGGTTACINNTNKANVTFQRLTITPTGASVIGIECTDSATNFNVNDNTISGNGVGIQYSGSITITGSLTGNTVTNCQRGINFDEVDFSSGFTYSSNTVTGSQDASNGYGFRFGGTGGSTGIGTSLVATGNAISGFLVSGAGSVITLNSCTSNENSEDGFHITGTSGGLMTCNNCIANSNGSASAGFGDGFTAHAGDSMTVRDCQAFGNWNPGVATTFDAGTITIEGCIFGGNGRLHPTDTRDSNIWINQSTGSVSIDDIISLGAEFAVTVTATAVAGTTTFSGGDNIYREVVFSYNGASRTFAQWQTDVAPLDATGSISGGGRGVFANSMGMGF
jgi:hypothetical protein